MMTFTYVALLSGLVAYNTAGGADSIMQRISVSSAALLAPNNRAAATLDSMFEALDAGLDALTCNTATAD